MITFALCRMLYIELHLLSGTISASIELNPKGPRRVMTLDITECAKTL